MNLGEKNTYPDITKSIPNVSTDFTGNLTLEMFRIVIYVLNIKHKRYLEGWSNSSSQCETET